MCSKCQQQKYNWGRLEWNLAAIFESTYSPVSAASISSPYYGPHTACWRTSARYGHHKEIFQITNFFSSNTFPFTFKGSTRLHRAFYSAPRLTFAQLKIINLISTISFSYVRSFSISFWVSVQCTEQNQAILWHELDWPQLSKFLQNSIRYLKFLYWPNMYYIF